MRKFAKDPAVVSKLTPEQFRVTQEGGTERPGTGEYLHKDQPPLVRDRPVPLVLDVAARNRVR